MFTKLFLASTIVLSLPASAKSLERGKYLVRIMGCNDCHTPMYAMKGGQVPEADWLKGTDVGFNGPWGTTYPANLRQIAQSMDEKSWVSYLKNFQARPPMPSYDTNRLAEADMRDIYRFIKSLGPAEFAVPAFLPPGVTPKTPYIDFSVHAPK